eukprot:Nitzschia sp. Nitz4//scaffold67_size101165//64552//66429//NITZ4_004533-RA/size101165-processed-gene-0.44-mRNA-1//1//CDS//3329556486//7685//frame0
MVSNIHTAASSSLCGLYLAPSTIPNAGLGVFTTRALQRGDWIDAGGDPVIPILDLEWYNGWESEESRNPFQDYVWSGHALGMGSEAFELELVTAMWPGLDAAVNSHPALNNLERSIPTQDASMGGTLHRISDHSVGSFTPYSGGNTYVKENIPAGGELFKHYGDDWFLRRNYTFPVASDYPVAVDLLAKFGRNVDPVAQSAVYEMLLHFAEVWDHPRILQPLPPSWEEIRALYAPIKPPLNRDISQFLRSRTQLETIRSLDWLGANGICMDALERRPSTIPGAGHGSFARHSFETGDVLTISPLIHVLDKNILTLKHMTPDPHDSTRHVVWNKNGTQIMINYCFSHNDTSLLLCPYGAGVTSINHASAHQANVRIEWPHDGVLSHDSSYLQKPINAWDETVYAKKLALQFVATKPIQSGDELFLDYGNAWIQAWEKHKVLWSKPGMHQNAGYLSAAAWNGRYHHKDLLYTEEEWKSTWVAKHFPRAPSNLALHCHLDIFFLKHHMYSRLKWDASSMIGSISPEYGVPCEVVDRKEVWLTTGNSTTSPRLSHRYEVVAKVPEYFGLDEPVSRRYNVPRTCLRWFDKPHTTDLHLVNAFRYPMQLPDSMVSQEWRNLARAHPDMAVA